MNTLVLKYVKKWFDRYSIDPVAAKEGLSYKDFKSYLNPKGKDVFTHWHDYHDRNVEIMTILFNTDKPLCDVGKAFGISKERVRQIMIQYFRWRTFHLLRVLKRKHESNS